MTCKIETLREVAPYMTLKRCVTHGIAFVADGTAGVAHSAHPNASSHGNPQAIYGPHARIIRCNGWAYNTSTMVATDAMDEIARQACRCKGSH